MTTCTHHCTHGEHESKGPGIDGIIGLLAIPVILLLPFAVVALVAATDRQPHTPDLRRECVAAGGVPLLGEGGWEYSGCMAGQPGVSAAP